MAFPSVTLVGDCLPVHEFASIGDLNAIKQLNFDNITALTSNHQTALDVAVEFDQLDVVTYFIDNYPTMLQHTSKKGDSVLHVAVIHKRTSVVARLMRDYITVFCDYKPNMKGRTPIQEAIVIGFFEGLVIMLNCKPEWLTIVDNYTRTLLHLAIDYEKTSMLIYLLTIAPKDMLLIQCDEGNTPLSSAVFQNSLIMVKLLYHANPAAVYIPNSQDMTPFLLASNFNFVLIMQYLMKCNPSVIEAKTKDGRTVLHFMRDVTTAKKVLQIKPYLIFEIDHNNQNVLHSTQNPEFARFLINAEPHLLNMTDDNGKTPYQLAIDKNECSILNSILQCKPELNDRYQNGNTVLHVAVEQCNNETIAIVFANNMSNLYRVNNIGNTPFHVAVSTQNIFALQLFQQHVSVEMSVETRDQSFSNGFKFDLQSLFFLRINSLHQYLLPELVDIVYESLGLPKTKKRKHI